jgi:hypothetical protein
MVSVDEVEHFAENQKASVATLRRCSASARNTVRLPFGKAFAFAGIRTMNRHPPTQADFDSGNGSCQGRTSLDGSLLMKVAEPEPRCFERRGSLPPSKPQYKLSLECFEPDD